MNLEIESFSSNAVNLLSKFSKRAYSPRQFLHCVIFIFITSFQDSFNIKGFTFRNFVMKILNLSLSIANNTIFNNNIIHFLKNIFIEFIF